MSSVGRQPSPRITAGLLTSTAGKLGDLYKQEKFADAMKLLSGLRQPIDRFFDKIMVNCEDKELRANRLRLLSSIRGSMDAIADFSAIEGDAKEQKKAA